MPNDFLNDLIIKDEIEHTHMVDFPNLVKKLGRAKLNLKSKHITTIINKCFDDSIAELLEAFIESKIKLTDDHVTDLIMWCQPDGYDSLIEKLETAEEKGLLKLKREHILQFVNDSEKVFELIRKTKKPNLRNGIKSEVNVSINILNHDLK